MLTVILIVIGVLYFAHRNKLTRAEGREVPNFGWGLFWYIIFILILLHGC